MVRWIPSIPIFSILPTPALGTAGSGLDTHIILNTTKATPAAAADAGIIQIVAGGVVPGHQCRHVSQVVGNLGE